MPSDKNSVDPGPPPAPRWEPIPYKGASHGCLADLPQPVGGRLLVQRAEKGSPNFQVRHDGRLVLTRVGLPAARNAATEYFARLWNAAHMERAG